MDRDADFWEAMYRAVIRRLGVIAYSDDYSDEDQQLKFQVVTRAHIDPTGDFWIDQVPKDSP